jgi:hypothetical protein
VTKFKITPAQWEKWLADPCTGRLLEVIGIEVEQYDGIIAGARRLAASSFAHSYPRLDEIRQAANEAVDAGGALRALTGIRAAIVNSPRADAIQRSAEDAVNEVPKGAA